jgi:hypothetical protein
MATVAQIQRGDGTTAVMVCGQGCWLRSHVLANRGHRHRELLLEQFVARQLHDVADF